MARDDRWRDELETWQAREDRRAEEERRAETEAANERRIRSWRWIRQADPKGELPLREAVRRGEALEKAHMARLQLARLDKRAAQRNIEHDAEYDAKRATLLGKIGGYTASASHGSDATARKMREGWEASWLRKADPDGNLPLEERTRRAEALKKAHYAKMQLARLNNQFGGTDEQRERRASRRASLQGKIIAYTASARRDHHEMARSRRAGWEASWLRKADPEGVLSPEDRAQRAEGLKKAHMEKMRLARLAKQAARKAEREAMLARARNKTTRTLW